LHAFALGTALALVGMPVNILPLVLYSKVSETGTDLPAASAASLVLVAIGEAVGAGEEAADSPQRRTGNEYNEAGYLLSRCHSAVIPDKPR
jgi:ABC-type sulfate transport system permease component